MRIDCHSHLLPESYLELFTRNPHKVKAKYRGNTWTISYGEIQEYRLDLETYQPKKKLEEMDRLGIDAAILSTNIPGPELLAPDLALQGARIINDYLAEMKQQHPGRFASLASLPWQDTKASLEELDRALDELGCCGVVLYSNMDGQPVDSSVFEPIYKRIAERDIPIVFHPTVPSWGEAIKDHSMIPMMGFQVDTSFAALRLILGGVLERYPNLKVVVPHAGGVLPYMMGRIDHQTEALGRGREHIKHAPSTYFRRLYIDTVTPSSQTLHFALEFSGVSQVLFGTDHPWVDAEILVNRIKELGLPEEVMQAVFSKNAQQLFKL